MKLSILSLVAALTPVSAPVTVRYVAPSTFAQFDDLATLDRDALDETEAEYEARIMGDLALVALSDRLGVDETEQDRQLEACVLSVIQGVS